MNTAGYNYGYGEAGASYSKRALKGFTAQSLSAHEDIDPNNTTLRQRARVLYMSSPIATSAIRTNRTNVVGCGLKLKARIDRSVLKMTAEQADRWERQTETEFALWASKKQNCDATGINDFYSMQQLCHMSYLLSGDCFVLVKHVEPTTLAPYGLRLHIVEADRISTPLYVDNKLYTPYDQSSPVIYDGVEVDKNGAVVAYHICSAHPDSLLSPLEKTWTRVKAYGKKTGLPNILHIMSSERPEQYRGVSFLSHVIEPLLQLRRYADSELTAAIIESYFTGFVKKPEVDSLGVVEPDDEAGDREYDLGPATINHLGPGEDIVFTEPHRPANGFTAFVKAIAEQVGAALEIPSDLLLKAFNASYSASRAALLEAWKSFKMHREWFSNDFCRPVYEIWLSEAVASGRIHAPGFFSDPFIRAAWLGCEWIGPSQGQLDPVKEITAETLAIMQGISTREQSTVRVNGGSWDSNVEQLSAENKLLAKANGTAQESANNEITNIVKMALSEAIKEVTGIGNSSETVLEYS